MSLGPPSLICWLINSLDVLRGLVKQELHWLHGMLACMLEFNGPIPTFQPHRVRETTKMLTMPISSVFKVDASEHCSFLLSSVYLRITTRGQGHQASGAVTTTLGVASIGPYRTHCIISWTHSFEF